MLHGLKRTSPSSLREVIVDVPQVTQRSVFCFAWGCSALPLLTNGQRLCRLRLRFTGAVERHRRPRVREAGAEGGSRVAAAAPRGVRAHGYSSSEGRAAVRTAGLLEDYDGEGSRNERCDEFHRREG
jgi:hypothetical protein